MRKRLDELEAESRRLDWTGDVGRAQLEEAAAFAARFLDGIGDAPAWLGSEAPSLDDAPPTMPSSLRKVLEDYQQIALCSGVNLVSGRFFGYVPGGGIPTAAVGDLLAGITNRYVGVYMSSPGGAAIENQLIQWIRDLVGMPDTAWGTLQSGGTLATLTALVAARSGRPIEQWSRSVLYSTIEAHNCFDKSIAIAGLHGAARRHVATDAAYRMNPDALRAQIAADRSAGLEPWIVCASAGTVNTGAIDPLNEIADVCAGEGLWMHVDGAYGGFFVLTEEGTAALRGMERADSLVLDPHKGLFQRYGCGAVLVRDGSLLKRAMSYRADYLSDAESERHPSAADYSPELTRHFRGLGLWLSLRVHGLDRYRAALEEKLLLGRYAHDCLGELSGLQVGPEPQLSIAIFRVDASDDEPTRRLLADLLQRGRIHLSSTRLAGQLWLRLCVLSFRSHRADVDAAIAEIDSLR